MLNTSPSLEFESLFRVPPGACPDCPACNEGVFAQFLPSHRMSCTFRCAFIRARDPLPELWFSDFGIGLVRRGMVIRQRYTAHGRTTAVDAIGSGGLLMLASANPASCPSSATTGYAATDALVCLCNLEVLRAAMANEPSMMEELLRLQSKALDRVERLADARGRPTVLSRTAALLCALFDTLSPAYARDHLPIDLQQRDLAALCAARPESICRALTRLTSARAILRDSDGIHLLNRQKLEAF